VGRLSGQGAQLEVTVSSPLGTFVEQRFDELWRHSKPMDLFMHLPVTLVESDGSQRKFDSRFVLLDDMFYVVDHNVVTEMARRRDGQLSAYCRSDTEIRYELIVVDDRDVPLRAALDEHFAEKYDVTGSGFVCLRPIEEPVAT
jgi:hypothetical protein